MKRSVYQLTTLLLSISATAIRLYAAGPSEADVGDPDSFGNPANYMGAASGQVVLTSDCTGITPPTQCYTTPLPGNSFTANNICQINLPKGSTKDIIYPVLNFFHNYFLQNTGATPQNGQFRYTASITIDSTALNDPTCIDPNTGLQCGGHLVMQFADSGFLDNHTMQPNDQTIATLHYTHAGNLGITKRSLVESGIPQSVADSLFKGPMTLHLNLSGTGIMLNNASITGNMRLFGD